MPLDVGVLLRPRSAVAAAVGAVVVGSFAWSAWKDVPHSWRLLRTQYAAYHGLSRAERDQEFISALPLRTDIFDFWRAWLRPGDRYWIQIPYEAFSTNADKKLVVRSVSHLYLLPAVEARSPVDATVVLSWDADPGLLHLRYLEQHRAGLQLIFVSWIDHGR